MATNSRDSQVLVALRPTFFGAWSSDVAIFSTDLKLVRRLVRVSRIQRLGVRLIDNFHQTPFITDWSGKAELITLIADPLGACHRAGAVSHHLLDFAGTFEADLDQPLVIAAASLRRW